MSWPNPFEDGAEAASCDICGRPTHTHEQLLECLSKLKTQNGPREGDGLPGAAVPMDQTDVGTNVSLPETAA